MRAGKLRHRITIQQKAETLNAYGEPIYTWSTKAKVWASIEPASGREYIEGGRQAQDVTHQVTMRHQTGITPEMRVSFVDRTNSTRTFDIERVLEPLVRGVELQLMCRENV